MFCTRLSTESVDNSAALALIFVSRDLAGPVQLDDHIGHLGARRLALKDIVVDDRLYASEADELLNVIHKLGDKLERVMLFRHNPELTELAHRLSSEITHMPTCAVAEFTFVTKSWSDIGKAKLEKGALDYPKKS